MPRPPRVALLALAASFALAGPHASRGDEPENFRQLQAMPRERRVALSDNLERFDKLDPAEQAAIRKLDAAIARQDPVEQERYRSLLRRYHLWVNGLTEDERAQLKATEGTEARLNLARKLRRKEIQGGATGPKLFGIRTGDYGVIGPHQAAYRLRIWKLLTPAKKLEIERLHERGAVFKAIDAQHASVGVAHQPFPAAEEDHYEALLNADEAFKRQLGPSYGVRKAVTQRKAEAAAAKGEVAHQRFELRYAEFLYFEEHKPRAVSRANLERFSAWCPNWFREMLDPLSPDDARAYLTIVYRLLYPDPSEMPAEVKPARAPDASKPPAERSAPKKSGPAAPF